jgi:POT family proton-dependent oligopeptide transporter
MILFIASVLFWGAFEQAGGSLNLFAERKSQLQIGSIDVPSSWYQNINPFAIMVLAPLFAYMWLKLGERAPSSPAKFSIGLLFVGAGFVVAAFGSALFDQARTRINPAWLFSVYTLHTIGELCLSPIGLSMVTKLAPARAISQVMSIWFLSNAIANFLAGQTVALNERLGGDTQIFWAIAAVTIGAGILLAAMAPRIKRLMGGVH